MMWWANGKEQIRFGLRIHSRASLENQRLRSVRQCSGFFEDSDFRGKLLLANEHRRVRALLAALSEYLRSSRGSGSYSEVDFPVHTCLRDRFHFKSEDTHPFYEARIPAWEEASVLPTNQVVKNFSCQHGNE